MKLIIFFALAAFFLTMASCQKELETESLSPQIVIENQTNRFKLRLIANHPDDDTYIDVPELDCDEVELVAELGIFNEWGTEVVASDHSMLPVTLS